VERKGGEESDVEEGFRANFVRKTLEIRLCVLSALE